MSEVPSQGTDWEAELNAAAAADEAAEQPGAPSTQETPAGDPAPDVQPQAPVTPDGDAPSVTPDAPTQPADTFDGGEFNPDLLPPELQPGWHQLQGAFTRKTQELAEQRKELESLAAQFGNTDEVAHAVQLRSAISDPANWPALYQELAGLMEQQGMELPGATPALPVPAAQPPLAPPAEVDDPELAPLMDRINALQTAIDGMNAAAQEQALRAQAEHEYAQKVAQFEAQERQIRDLYPAYKESDWESIYTAVPFFGGNLIAAQQHYEADRQRHIEAYLAGKQGAQGIAPAMPPEGGLATTEQVAPLTFEQVGREAEEHLRALQAAGELDL